MDEYVFLAATLKLGYALLAVFGLVYLTRWLDRRAGIRFADIAAGIRSNETAAAIYYGLRILALALLVGMVIGCTPASAADGADALAEGNAWLRWILLGAVTLLAIVVIAWPRAGCGMGDEPSHPKPRSVR